MLQITNSNLNENSVAIPTNNDKRNEPKLITITRSDLPPGDQLAQSVHSTTIFCHQHPSTFHKWMSETNSVVCLAIKDESALLKYYEKFSKLTECSIFFEPDISQFTSICLYASAPIRKKLKHLPLCLKK